MAEIDLAATMDAIADALTAGAEPVTSRAYAWPADAIQPPCAIVGYPGSIDFDETFGRGSDRATIPVWFAVGKATTRTARDELSRIIAGARSVKAAIDGPLGGAVQTARVTDCEITELVVAGVEYLAVRFDVDVIS